MGADVAPLVGFTLFWGLIGGALPFAVPKSPNRGIIQVALIMTAACCWLFWLCAYMAQMNPLIGPRLDRNHLLIIAREWGNQIKD
ncbi:ATP synt H domain containing protein [Asbolus verrucosus]|uniref:V-type proton ATPase subunit n=1 Tax=Asbolus verrucosus TaxID=1661398 RepID=A0A482VU12_ASBVE|nr:ATP synt H domain containing protein [Asbolus verrucosus]